jgi:hypothetical protein
MFIFFVFVLILFQVKWKESSYFVIFGEISISDCEWNLQEIIDDGTHFQLNGGIFKCNNLVVSSYNKSTLKFLNFTENNNITVSCIELVYRNITCSLSTPHFSFCGGGVSFTDSV